MEPRDPDPFAPGVVPLATCAVYVSPGFLDPAACRQVRAAMDRGTAEPAEILTDTTTRDRQARRATSIDIDEVTRRIIEAQLDAVRQSLAGHYQIPLTTREGPGFLRYEAGDFYRRHRDRAFSASWPRAAQRQLSVVVFLKSSRPHPAADEFSGGELLVWLQSPDDPATTEPVRVTPREGCLVVFPASLLHEVRPVRAGTRDVIVDWYY